MATQRVGGEVDALCTRCKMNLAHTILAMVGTKIARVRCNTCGGDHVYRTEAGTSSSSSRAANPRVSRAEKVVISFQERLAGQDLAAAPAYSPRETYAVDQVLRHPTFGVGIVSAVRQDKIDVAFKADQKTLVHGRGAPKTPSEASQSADGPSGASSA